MWDVYLEQNEDCGRILVSVLLGMLFYLFRGGGGVPIRPAYRPNQWGSALKWALRGRGVGLRRASQNLYTVGAYLFVLAEHSLYWSE